MSINNSSSSSSSSKSWIIPGVVAAAATAAALGATAYLSRRSGKFRSRVIGIIPARYASSRFQGKPLVNILGKPMIQVFFCFFFVISLGNWILSKFEFAVFDYSLAPRLQV